MGSLLKRHAIKTHTVMFALNTPAIGEDQEEWLVCSGTQERGGVRSGAWE